MRTVKPFLPLLALAALFFASRPAEAFCIENRADEALTFVVDIDGKGNNAPYVRRLGPGEQGCCDWQRYDCNASKKRDGVLSFSVTRIIGNQEQRVSRALAIIACTSWLVA